MGESKGKPEQPPEARIEALIQLGESRGYLTYEEMNDGLPDEVVSPDRLDRILMTLDEKGVDLIDEPPPRRKPKPTNASMTPSACISRRWVRSRC